MTLPSLKTALPDLPKVLAGPILRRVTAKSATVWLALRIGATVTMTVKDSKDAVVMTGQRHSVAVGENLHIVAVTAHIIEKDCTEGVVYQYALEFSFDNKEKGNLAEAMKAQASDFAYPEAGLGLPSFALPPKNLNQLRIFQGSCRKPSGDGDDMLAFLDGQIRASAKDPFKRPHQLLLTGDQIYADDVATSLLALLRDAADVLLGWKDLLPNQAAGLIPATAWPPAARRALAEGAGLTSEDLDTHLFSLGEYLCMYLFAWSPVLWASRTLPTWEDIRNGALQWDPDWKDDTGLASRFIERMFLKQRKKLKAGHSADNDRLVAFRRGLTDVRRALANVPTSMIFDDHEVTDDWNMDKGFCRKVYGSSVGRRIVRNGLLAYALCQHWGNRPEDFENDAAGAKLLKLLDPHNPAPPTAVDLAAKGSDYESASAQIMSLLGLPAAGLDSAKALIHDTGALNYDHVVEGPGHMVIFTDTRTWRSFPPKRKGTHLLSPEQFRRQIVETPPLAGRQLMVVLTTNAPPVQFIRSATRHDGISNTVQFHPDLYEAWDLPSESFDRLLSAVTSKLPKSGTLSHKGAVLLLSGDVHMSFASRLIYRATRRFEDGQKAEPTEAVIAQLVASSLKKQTDDTVNFHRQGYFFGPAELMSQPMIRHTLTEGYVGWDPKFWPSGTAVGLGVPAGILGPIPKPKFQVLYANGAIDVSPAESISDDPVSSKIELSEKPDFRYRHDYLLPTGEGALPGGQVGAPPLPLASASKADRARAARQYQDLMSTSLIAALDLRVIIGRNNIAELTFGGDATAPQAFHRLFWNEPDRKDSSKKYPSTRLYTIRLDVNDPKDTEFPDIKARSEP